ncbi:MAG: sigma-54-dependent Fis family transcriptional regulator [Rhodospirillaceae bacterium]|nr:sigma-54-dependent Fis family transcriptional regulator [Rhodospirillaceae bacterium]
MRLLIVGMLEGHISNAGQIAISRGATVSQVDSVDAGLHSMRGGQGADLVMIDIKLPIGKFFKSMKEERMNTPVVACGVSNDPDAAVAAIKAGAKEYIPLPPNPEMIAAILQAVSEEQTSVIFKDPLMAGTLKLAAQIAPSDASVLVTGESGTGKEVLARFIHSKSKRSSESFVSVNCAAIPDNLLESELFGHEKGAFTGAVARRIGKFEEADGGTLLLDEISEMDIRLQAKLLRAIQEREIDRVGGSKPVKVNIRLIATSNRDLEKHVQDEKFREDLYFRLNVFNLQLPSLRERPGDIQALADHFAEKYSDANGLPNRPITKEALERLQKHGWRGNVRELENTMHRAVLLASGDVIDETAIMLTGESLLEMRGAATSAVSPLGSAAASASAPAPLVINKLEEGESDTGGTDSTLIGKTVAEVERQLIINTLEHCLGNRTHAATILGISIRTLRNKLKTYSDEGVNVPPSGELEGAHS